MSFQALYVGSTGMVTHSTRMQNIGNNIANVNTVAFKTADMNFTTLISENIVAGNSSSTNGISQVGLGTAIGSVYTDYRNGALTAGSEITDLAISGKGFFRVVDPDDATTHYTRAGNFRFDNDGYLIDPSGYRLQGQMITDGVNGATTDIQLTADDEGRFSIPASATTQVNFIPNIGFDESYSTSAANPFFSMLENWDGTSDPALGSGMYGFSSPIQIYDSSGTQRTLTLYIDKAELSNSGGRDYFEFILSMDPTLDGRDGVAGTSGAGLLLAGTLAFDSTGQLVDLSAFSYSGTGDATALSNWTPTTFTANGYPEVTATYASGASATFGMNFGISGDGWDAGVVSNAAAVGGNYANLPSLDGESRSALATTAHSGTSAVAYMSQNGYAEGILSTLSMDRDGIMVGHYSNGMSQELFQVTLYNFTSEYGLRREGGNHFSATLASGQAVEGYANQENFGGVNSSTLEESNVDIADQFARMILTEKGFQANSKVITTADEIIKQAIQMKR